METFVRAEEPTSPSEYNINELKRQTDMSSDYDIEAKANAF